MPNWGGKQRLAGHAIEQSLAEKNLQGFSGV